MILKRFGQLVEFLIFMPFIIIIRMTTFSQLEKLAIVSYYFLYPISILAKKRIIKNLKFIFPEMSNFEMEKFAKQNTMILYRQIFELLHIDKYEDKKFCKKYIRVSDRCLDFFKNNINGGIVLAGHLGNYELTLGYFSQIGLKISAVGKEMSNPFFNFILNFLRKNYTSKIIHPGDSKGLLKALKEGHFIALVADQDGGSKGVFVDFLGKEASSFQGPGILGYLSEKNIVFVSHIFKGKGVYEIDLIPLFIPLRKKDFSSKEIAVHSVCQKYAFVLEQCIKEHSLEYLWVHRRWKTRPVRL